MSHWTDLLPPGAEKPIVIEILHPMQQKTDAPKPGDKFTAMDPRLRADMEQLVGDAAFVESHQKMVKEIGADSFLIFFIGAEHWRGKDSTTGKPALRAARSTLPCIFPPLPRRRRRKKQRSRRR